MSFTSDKVCALNAELEELFRPEAAYSHLLLASAAADASAVPPPRSPPPGADIDPFVAGGGQRLDSGEEVEDEDDAASPDAHIDSLIAKGERPLGAAADAARGDGSAPGPTFLASRALLPEASRGFPLSGRSVAPTLPSISQRQRSAASAQTSAKQCAVIWDAIQQLGKAGSAHSKLSLAAIDTLLSRVRQCLHGADAPTAPASEASALSHYGENILASKTPETVYGGPGRSFGTDAGDRESRERVRAGLRRMSGSSLNADMSGSSLNAEDAHLHDLEWFFLCRCSVIVYGHVLERLLVATLPLAEDISYWTDVRESVTWTALYAIQTAPLRLRSMGIHVYHRLRSLPLNVAGSSLSPRLAALGTMFWNPKRLVFSSGLFTQNALMQIPATHLSLLGFIRREISLRVRRLRTFREHQAACLGLLADRGFELPTSSLPLMGVDWVPAQLAKSLVMMRTTLEQARGFADSPDGAVEWLDVPNIEATAPPLSVHQAYQQISQLIKLVPAHAQTTRKVTGKFGRPSRLVRYWLPALFGYFGARNGYRSVYGRRADLLGLAREVAGTGKAFFVNWIVKPWTEVWRTVRHTEHRLQLSGEQSLASDTESLERMVADFAAEYSPGRRMDETARLAVMESVRRGDLTAVLRKYEEELRTPVRSALFGGLIRALLIQIQKAKVDVDLTMAALDKLLRSNELNFAFLAAFPALFVGILTARWLRRAWSRSWHIGERRAVGEVIATLRQIVQSLNRVNALSAGGEPTRHLGFKDEGYLLCQVHLLRSHSRYLPRGYPTGRAASRVAFGAADFGDDPAGDAYLPAPSARSGRAPTVAAAASRSDGGAGDFRRDALPRRPRERNCDEGFVIDLRDLENTHLTVGQKLETARRMYLEGLLWAARLR